MAFFCFRLLHGQFKFSFLIYLKETFIVIIFQEFKMFKMCSLNE